jgi:adenylosuccinate synthase
MLNGVSQLVVTKIDVLNAFHEIMMATQYAIEGKNTDQLPFDICDVDIKPVLERFEGWESSLDGIEDFADLPDQAKTFIKALEGYLKVPVTMISTGPARQELIHRNIKAEV